MSYAFFYVSVIIVIIIFVICVRKSNPSIAAILIGITSIAYSLIFDITFGQLLGLYHYIDPQASILYILLSGIFVYPLLNVIYILFLPVQTTSILVYTIFWIAVMLIFEYLSIISKTVVFTGWKPLPWSLLTYAVTYSWINALYRYLKNEGFGKRILHTHR
jgi:hypothetical protein